MNILKFAAVAAAVALSAQSAPALKVSDDIKNPNVFAVEFPEGTAFYGRADKLVSVSKQEFVAGPLFVTEVCLEFDRSPLQVRIYNSRALPSNAGVETLKKNLPDNLKQYATPPKGVQKLLDEKTKNAATQQFVYKDYPATTHARTLEFVVADVDELGEFFKKVSECFANQAGEKINGKKFILEDKRK